MTTTKAEPVLAGNMRTILEAAGDMKVCRTTVYSLLEAGLLPSVKIPGTRARRIPRHAIERLLESGLTGEGEA